VWFQSLVEIGHAYRTIDNCKNYQNDRYYRETGKCLSDRKVESFVARLVHPGKLEDEVGQTAKEADKGGDHPECVLPAGRESCQKENDDCDGDCGNGDPMNCTVKPRKKKKSNFNRAM
jgi:hypothetical protein